MPYLNMGKDTESGAKVQIVTDSALNDALEMSLDVGKGRCLRYLSTSQVSGKCLPYLKV
jgi:hypothetical protein